MRPESRRVIGLDLAWSERNGSGLAVARLEGRTLQVEAIHCRVRGLEAISRLIRSTDNLAGIAVDAPLIINNPTGKRGCEKDLTRAYGSRHAGCHSSNLSLYPNAISVRLSEQLSSLGFGHLTDPAEGKWQLEVYPHPAIIEIFGLPERHLYKKGCVVDKQTGQARLAQMLVGLADHPVLALSLPDALQDYFDGTRIVSLRGQALKDNEDALDSVLCLYIAGLYAMGHPMQCFGDVHEGYIVVPMSRTVIGQDGAT